MLWSIATSGLICLLAADPATESPTDSLLLEVPVDTHLEQVTTFLRPTTAEDLANTARALAKLEANAYSNQLFQDAQQLWLEEQRALPVEEWEPIQAVRRLLQQGQLAIADTLLQQYVRQHSDDNAFQILQSICYLGQGQVELALRSLRSVRGELSTQRQQFVDMLSMLLQMQLAGQVPGVDVNPWGVQFVGDSGEFEPGSIAEDQKEKLPENIQKNLANLLLILPMQGNLWGLYGEILNASGNPAAALVAFNYAKGLQYYPRKMRDHTRILEEHQRELATKLEQQLAQSSSQPSQEAKTPSEEEGVQQFGSRTKVLAVVVIGGLLVLALVVMQIREWRRR